MNDILETIKSVQKMENKYIEILESDLRTDLGKLTKGEIAEKLAIVSEKIKQISYQAILEDNSKKEEFAQLSALKKILHSMYDHNHYSRNVDIKSLLKK